MKKFSKILLVLLALVLTLTLLVACGNKPDDTDTSTDTSTDTETGTTTDTDTGKDTDTDTDTDPAVDPDAPVEIANVADLMEAAKKIAENKDGYASKTFILTADITLTEDFGRIVGFKGVFDGQFHTISGLVIDEAAASIGLFDILDGAEVRNLFISGAEISNSTADCSAGILAGKIVNSKIAFVSVDGKITASGNKVVAGGLAGSVENSTIINTKSTVAVSGSGAKVGGLFGVMGDKAMIVNAYVDADITAKATVKGAAVGSKTADSAIAYVLVKSGSIAGKVLTESYLPDYIIACKTGVENAAQMGWNAVDWDVSGEAPALKTDADKNHTVTVKIDGKDVTASYGESVSASIVIPADTDEYIAVIGYVLGSDFYYPALPVINDLTLTQKKIDYSSFVGTYVGLLAADGTLVVDKNVVLGETEFTRVWLDSSAIYLKDSKGTVYALSITNVKGYSADAYFIELKNLSDNSTKYFTVGANLVGGAWEKDGVVYIVDVAFDVYNGKTVLTVLNTTTGAVTYAVPYVNVNGDYALDGFAGLNGLVLTIDEETGKVSLKNAGAEFEMSVSTFNGTWVSKDGTLIEIKDGKYNGVALVPTYALMSTAVYVNGDEMLVFVACPDYILIADKDGNAVAYTSNDFGGEYVYVKDGNVLKLRIVGNDVYVNGSETPVTAVIGFSNGNSTLTVAVGETTYTFVKNGNTLVDSEKGVVMRSDKATEKFLDAVYVLGTDKFVFKDGKVTVGDTTLNLAFTYSGEKLILLSAGSMTFAYGSAGDLTVKGYNSKLTGEGSTVTLFTEAEVKAFLDSLTEAYVAGYVEDAPLTFKVKDGVFTINDVSYDYELSRNGSTFKISFVHEESNADNKVSTFEPNGMFARVGRMSYGNAVVEKLWDVIGFYYDSFYTAEPVQVYFTADGVLGINGTKYSASDYTVAFDGTKVTFTIAKEGEDTITVVFNNKVATVGETNYYNYDRILPVPGYDESEFAYVVIGGTKIIKISLVKGSVGTWDSDDEEWYDQEFPLYGFALVIDGVKYSSTSYTWVRNEDGSASLTVVAKNDTGNEKTFVVTYFDATRKTTVKLTVDGVEYTPYSVKNVVSKYAGDYKNAKGTVSFTKDGLLVVNGVAVDYELTTGEDGKYSFKVGDKTYVVDPARREIAKCGDEVFYDVRLAFLAGIKLIGFTEGAFEDNYVELTEEGLKMNGVLVKWNSYDTFMFTTKIGDKDVQWRGNSSGFDEAVRSFGLYIYQSNNGDYKFRAFMPEILKDCVGEHAVVRGNGTVLVFSVIAPYVDGNYTYPFSFTIGASQYSFGNYTLSQTGNTLTVTFDDGKVMTFTPGDGGCVITLDGVAASAYEAPDKKRFVVSKKAIFGCTRAIDVITIEVGEDGTVKWIYNPDGESWSQKSGTTFNYGMYKGDNMLIIPASGSFLGAVVFIEDGEVWVVDLDLFNLAISSTKTPDGKNIAFSLGVVTTGEGEEATKSLKLTAKIDKDNIDLTILSANYDDGGNNHVYFKYTYSKVDYAVALNCDSETKENYPAVVLTLAEFNKCYHYSLVSEHNTIYFFPIYDAGTGLGKIGYKLTNGTLVSFTKDADNVYKIVHKGADGVEYTDYAIMVDGEHQKCVKIVSETDRKLIGTHTDGDTTITIGVALNSYTLDFYAMFEGDENKYFMKSANGTYTFTKDTQLYAVYVSGESVKISKLNAEQNKFVGDARTTTYYKNAKVVFEGGEYKVIMPDGNYATDVAFASDSSYMTFTYGGVKYRIVYVESGSYHTGIITEDQAILCSATGKLKVTCSIGYSQVTFSATYDGSSVTLKTAASGIMYFEKGTYVYVVEVKDGDVSVVENAIDLNAEKYYSIRGTYEDSKDSSIDLVITYDVVKTEDGYKAIWKATYDDDDAKFLIEEDKGVIKVTVGAKDKYFALSGSSAYEVSDSVYSTLGSYEIGTHTISAKAYVSGSGRYASVKAKYSVDGISFSDSSKTTTDGKSYVQLSDTTNKVYYFLYVNGDTKVLQSVTKEELDKANLSKSAYPNGDSKKGYMYYKGAVKFNGETFTVVTTFGTSSAPAEVTLTDIAEGVQSFGEYNGVTYYYLTSGSYCYIVEKDFYDSTYKTFTAKNGTEFKFVWGSKILMIALKDGDAFGTAVEAVAASDGTHTYYSFTSGSVSYVLAKNSADEWVLTDLSTTNAPVHVKGFSYKGYSGTTIAKVANLDNKAVIDSFELIMSIDDNGVPSYAFKFGDTVVSAFEELGGGEVIKVTLDGTVRYFAYASYYDPTNSSYDNSTYCMVELTAAQAGLVGQSATIGGVTYKFLIKGPYSVGSSWYTVDPTVYIDGKGVKATFSADGASITFTSNGTTYTATMVGGIFTVTEA